MGPLSRYDHPWEKKNKHASVICLLAKNAKFHVFIDWGLKLPQQGSLIRWIWYVIFVKIVWLLGGVSPYFLKWGKFFQARNFWSVRLILMKLIYLKSALKCHSFDITTGIKIPFFFRVLVTIEPGRSLLQIVTTNCLKMWNFVFFVRRQITDACLFVFFCCFFFQGWSYRPSGPRMLREGSF